MDTIFVHGSGGCGDIWRHQTDYLQRSHAVNLPGHPEGQLLGSVQQYADWLRKYVKERRYNDVVLVGHSLGGAIVMMDALRYPQEIKGIVIIGSGARLRVHPRFLTPCEKAIKGEPEEWYRLVEEMYRSTPKGYATEMIEKHRVIGPAAMLNDFLCCDKFDVMDEVHEIRLPTLIICGELDIMTPVKYAHYLAAKIANSKIVIVPGAGHFVLAEKPHVVNKAIEEFLGGLSS